MNLPYTDKELIHAELEALKVSVIMLKINEQGHVENRILVHKDSIDHFANLGYAEKNDDYDPQIGHKIDLAKIKINKEKEKSLTKNLSIFQKIRYFLKRLFRKN